jgi:hypothetical protein
LPTEGTQPFEQISLSRPQKRQRSFSVALASQSWLCRHGEREREGDRAPARAAKAAQVRARQSFQRFGCAFAQLSSALLPLTAPRLHFAKRNETFRFRSLKSLKSLMTLNQPFRGFE